MLRTILGLLLVFSVPASAQTLKITKSGWYRLSADRLPVDPQLAQEGRLISIDIRADNVTLDLGGHTVRCGPPTPAAPITIGISAVDRANVTIKNGNVVGCAIGVAAPYGVGHVIERLDLGGNLHVGLNLGFGRNHHVAHCEFDDIAGHSGNSYAVGLNGAGSHSIVEHNTFRNITRPAGASGVEGVAILISGTEQSVLVRKNRIENRQDSPDIGIWVAENSSATVVENEIKGFGRGIVSAGLLQAWYNRVTFGTPMPDSIGIYTQRGRAFLNEITGFAVEQWTP